MSKEQVKHSEELNKSIDALIEDYFGKSENFEVANASKTTADAVMSEVPGSEDDKSRGAGRPEEDHDVPKNDEDGNPAKGYESVQKDQSEEEPEEAKKQAKAIDQVSKEGHMAEAPKMKDPRLSKSLTDEEFAEYQSLKKANDEAKAKAEAEAKATELKKSEELRKAELETLIKSAVRTAIEPVKKENEELKKSLNESQALLKAIASQPQRSKSVTGIDALEKSQPESSGPQEFTKSEKLDAAEALVKAKKIPLDAVIELENTGTIYNPEYRRLIEQELQKQN